MASPVRALSLLQRGGTSIVAAMKAGGTPSGARGKMHTQEMEKTVIHAFEKTWDRVYATFRRRYRGPAAELAAEEAYRRLAIKLQSNELPASARALVCVGDLLEDIVTDMLSPKPSPAKGTTPHATMRKSA